MFGKIQLHVNLDELSHQPERIIHERWLDGEKWWNWDLDWIRVNAGLCVCVCVISTEMQGKCGSVIVQCNETCQAGSNVGQTPQGISYPVLSLPLVHSAPAAPKEKKLLMFTNRGPKKLRRSLHFSFLKQNNNVNHEMEKQQLIERKNIFQIEMW